MSFPDHHFSFGFGFVLPGFVRSLGSLRPLVFRGQFQLERRSFARFERVRGVMRMLDIAVDASMTVFAFLRIRANVIVILETDAPSVRVRLEIVVPIILHRIPLSLEHLEWIAIGPQRRGPRVRDPLPKRLSVE